MSAPAREDVSRRHPTKSQRALALAQMEQTLGTESPSRAAAKLIECDHQMVVRARYVLNHAPDLVEQVEAGASLNDAYRVAAEGGPRGAIRAVRGCGARSAQHGPALFAPRG